MRFKVEAYDIEANFDGPRLFKLTLRESVDGEVDVNIVADHDEVLEMLLRPRKIKCPEKSTNLDGYLKAQRSAGTDVLRVVAGLLGADAAGRVVEAIATDEKVHAIWPRIC